MAEASTLSDWKGSRRTSPLNMPWRCLLQSVKCHATQQNNQTKTKAKAGAELIAEPRLLKKTKS